MQNFGFGLCRLRAEGCALHPDDINAELTDEQYEKQLLAYETQTGDKMARVGLCRLTNR